MSGNLPLGVTPADIDRHYGGGITDHEHEWEPVQGLSPILKDLAAIFHEQCRFEEIVNSYTDHQRDETYCETGAECKAERSYRFELNYVVTESGTRLDRDRLDRDEDGQVEEVFETVIEAKQVFPDDTEVIETDPDRQQGGSSSGTTASRSTTVPEVRRDGDVSRTWVQPRDNSHGGRQRAGSRVCGRQRVPRTRRKGTDSRLRQRSPATGR